VFDGTMAPMGDADVVIEAGRIVEVGPGLDGDERVDCAGLTVLPGLFDTHTHVMFSSIDWVEELMTPFSFMYYDAIRNLASTLATGITTVRDASGADAGVRKAVDDGVIPGPRMQISVTMLSQTGGHNDGWVPSGVDLNLDSITAVVIGGTSLFGGRGSIWGSLLGALIVGVFRNGLSLAGLDVLYQTLAVGILIIIAVSVDQWIRKVKS